jgi:hypothetical protein
MAHFGCFLLSGTLAVGPFLEVGQRLSFGSEFVFSSVEVDAIGATERPHSLQVLDVGASDGDRGDVMMFAVIGLAFDLDPPGDDICKVKAGTIVAIAFDKNCQCPSLIGPR